jgi:hypothetical protein
MKRIPPQPSPSAGLVARSTYLRIALSGLTWHQAQRAIERAQTTAGQSPKVPA